MILRNKLAATALAALSCALTAKACGPYFPASYFPHDCEECIEWEHHDTTIVARNSKVKAADAYRIIPHLGAELSMIGAHYYPGWTGKAPRSNGISTPKADELDFFESGAAFGASEEALAGDWRRFKEFCDSVCKRLENGEQVEIPQGVPDYAREFYLYKLGHAQWLVFRKDDDPAPFAQLLALPKELRRYRTVWVHFVRIANARLFADKDRHLDEMRKALDDGFKDTPALEAFALRFLSKTCGERYYPLVLTSYSGHPWTEWPGFAKRIFCRRHSKATPKREWVQRLCEDIVGVEVAIAYGAGGCLPQGATAVGKPALGADRQAWIAFYRGDLDLCRKLLAIAPEKSLIRLFLEARLARLDGNYEKAGEILHEWLEEYCRKGDRADDAFVGYGVVLEDLNYWHSGSFADTNDCATSTAHYTGRFGPSGEFWENLIYGNSFDFAKPGAHGPTLPRIVSGELGVVMVATCDLEEALYAFVKSRNWIDCAFVAERCMTVDELVAFMRGSRLDGRERDSLRSLLARRLVRNGRVTEAVMWAPQSLKPLCKEFLSLSIAAENAESDNDTRAVALFNLSRLALTRGMEIMGTELIPDVAVYGGDYDIDGIPIDEPDDLQLSLGPERAANPWDDREVLKDRVEERFHYRRKAMEYAKAAAELADDRNVRAWSLMLGGIAALGLDDAKSADWFYKRLARMRHPRAKVGAWFDTPEYFRFRRVYYNEERHAEPVRVPRRLTIDDFKEI